MNFKIKYIVASVFFVILFGCKPNNEKAGNKEVAEESVENSGELVSNSAEVVVETYDFKGFEKYLNFKDDKIYVINFWATWCKPCVEELPHFEELYQNYKDKNVEVILVSLDFPKKIDKTLIPFIKKNNIKSKVILLDDPKQNDWIPLVDENWSGAIPATVIYNKNSKGFYEQSFNYEQLEEQLNKFLN